MRGAGHAHRPSPNTLRAEHLGLREDGHKERSPTEGGGRVLGLSGRGGSREAIRRIGRCACVCEGVVVAVVVVVLVVAAAVVVMVVVVVVVMCVCVCACVCVGCRGL